ncbi:MAG: hypothetical protein II997_09425 [Clostridia bacterium]|nr:hypothetical protein [Clostridia bacterium]
MFKRMIGIFLISIMLMVSAMPVVMAAENPTLTLEQLVAPTNEGGTARAFCKNDNYMFVSYGTWVEVYSYDKDDPTKQPEYLTKVTYTSKRDSFEIPMIAYDIETVGNDYLAIAFCRPDGKVDYYGYSRLVICDVRSIQKDQVLTCSALVKLRDFTVGCYLNVVGNMLYMLEWQDRTDNVDDSAYLWSFDVREAVIIANKNGQNYNWEIDRDKQNTALDYNVITDYGYGRITYGTAAEGGEGIAAYMDGNYLYFVQKARLSVYDVTDRKNVIKKGFVALDGTNKYSFADVAAKDDYVFVGLGDASKGIFVFDVSQTKAQGTSSGMYSDTIDTETTLVAPTYIEDIYVPYVGAAKLCNKVMVNGDYLYVSWPQIHRLIVYDISDMSQFNFTHENLLDGIVTELDLKVLLDDKHANSVSDANTQGAEKVFNGGGFRDMLLDGDELYFTDTAYGIRRAKLSPSEQLGALSVTDGTTALEVLADGNLKSEITITNSSSKPYTGVLILAYYKNGALEDVETTPINIPAGEMDYKVTTEEAVVVSGAVKGDYVKAMLWSDVSSSLIPLVQGVTIEKN